MADRIPSGANAPSAAACAQDFSSSPLTDRSPCLLAVDAEDNADDLRTALQAYCAIEKLVAYHNTQAIAADRDEMGALLRLMNEQLAQRLATLDATVQALRGALRARETLQ